MGTVLPHKLVTRRGIHRQLNDMPSLWLQVDVDGSSVGVEGGDGGQIVRSAGRASTFRPASRTFDLSRLTADVLIRLSWLHSFPNQSPKRHHEALSIRISRCRRHAILPVWPSSLRRGVLCVQKGKMEVSFLSASNEHKTPSRSHGKTSTSWQLQSVSHGRNPSAARLPAFEPQTEVIIVNAILADCGSPLA